MTSHQSAARRPRGGVLGADRVADHLLVHQYIRVLGRRPTADELADGTPPRPGKGWGGSGRWPWTSARVLPRHAARLMALLAYRRG